MVRVTEKAAQFVPLGLVVINVLIGGSLIVKTYIPVLILQPVGRLHCNHKGCHIIYITFKRLLQFPDPTHAWIQCHSNTTSPVAIHSVYSVEKIVVKLSSSLQDMQASLVNLDLRS